MVYNMKVKVFPSGLRQCYLYSKPVFSDYTREPIGEKEIDSARSKSVSKSRSKVNAYDLALANEWDWFMTGTFDQKRFDAYDYDVFTDCVKLFTQCLRDRDILYLLVPELHPTSGRWHFHALLKGDFPKVQAINPHTGQFLFDASGRPIYNVAIYKYGFTTCTAVSDSRKSAGYIAKYLNKANGDVPKHKKRYWASRSLKCPVEIFDVVDDYNQILDELQMNSDYFKETKTIDYGSFAFAEFHDK